jgi:hypothetical protein
VALERRAARLTLPYRDVQRAKVVLYAADGMSNVQIADRLEMCSKVVGQWRRRFHEQRLAGLEDQPRSGRPRRFPPGRGRAGQGDRVRAAQDPMVWRCRVSAGLSFTVSSSSRRSAARRRRRSAAGWPRTRSSPGRSARGSSRATPTSCRRPAGSSISTRAAGRASCLSPVTASSAPTPSPQSKHASGSTPRRRRSRVAANWSSTSTSAWAR